MLDFSNFILDIKNYFLILLDLVYILLGIIIYLRNKKNLENFLFFLVLLGVTAWTTSMILYRGILDKYLSIIWARLLYFSASLIPIFFLYFSFVFKSKKFLLSIKDLFIIAPFIITAFISLYPNYLIKDVLIIPNEEKIIIFNRALHIFYAIYIMGYFSACYFILFKKFYQVSGLTKKQLLYLIFGTLISVIIGVSSNLLLPLFDIFTFNWLGQFGVISLVIMTTYGISKFNLFNIRIILTEVFTLVIIITSLGRILISTNNQDLIINITLFLLTFIFGILLIRSVYQEVQQREQLADLNKKLEYQYNLRGKILSIISHQVKSPLVNIREFVKFLIEGEYGQLSEKAKQILKRIGRNMDEEISLVSDLGEFRKLEENQIEFQFNFFNLVEIVKDVYEAYNPLAKEKNIELKLNINYEQLQIYGDREKLRQVLVNLVDNAIKYTEQGWVEIALEKIDGEILIKVVDTGIGINKEHLEDIFNEFIQLESKKNILGTGLGLYLSKKIVEAHNGQIWAESEGEGKGSVFYVKLPAKA